MPHKTLPAILFQFTFLWLGQDNEVMDLAVGYKLVCEQFGLLSSAEPLHGLAGTVSGRRLPTGSLVWWILSELLQERRE
jgi:hypothetical protein